MSDDEFDGFDDLANLEGVDWDTLLSVPAPQGTSANEPSHQSLSGYSSDYSFDEIDENALAELDALEQNVLQRPSRAAGIVLPRTISQFPSPQPNSATAVHISRSSPDLNGVACGSTAQTLTKRKIGDDLNSRTFKKPRSGSSPLKSHLPSGKGKEKANEEVLRVLSEFEDEFTCPICCDIFVAAHLGNPCGHSFCGDCGWQWSTTKNNGSCAVCRTKLSKRLPMIPNISMDNAVEKHIQTLGASGDEDWILGGSKYMEWNTRKEQWKKDVTRRARKGTTEKDKKRKVVEVQFNEMEPEFLYFVVPDDEDDGDYEEEGDVEADGSSSRRRETRNLRRRRTRV